MARELYKPSASHVQLAARAIVRDGVTYRNRNGYVSADQVYTRLLQLLNKNVDAAAVSQSLKSFFEQDEHGYYKVV
ncbi:hypothetical protein EVB91_202 [Rhizobium phage RHph_I1_18]|nr:hypothetical protein EVB91_202 [Rhizobium phage RHph_I1_18]